MRTFITALVFVALFSATALAEGVGVLPVRGTNLTEGEVAAIGAVIATSYGAKTGARVLDPSDTGPALAQAGSGPDAALQLGLSEYIEVRAVRLETRITLEATLNNVHGSALYTTRATLVSLDDLEVVADRISASLHRRTPIENTQNLDNVIGKETRVPNRTFSEKVIGFRLGGMAPVGNNVDVGGVMQLQFDARLEGTSYFLEIAGGFMLPSKFEGNDAFLAGLVGQLGASYYLGNASVAPYVGGGLSPRIMLGDYNGVGLTAYGRLGLMFMRQSSSRIYAEIGVDQNLLGLSRGDYGYETYDPATGQYVTVDPDDASVWPTELSIAVGIGW